MKPLFSPSLMSMDIYRTPEYLEVFEQTCQMLHIDIMDGHFAKNITLSPDFIKYIRPHTTLPIEAHLMVEDPAMFIPALKKAGADYITVHCEAITLNSFRTLNLIKAEGLKVGVAICPGTSVDIIREYADMLDLITLMGVEVGYAGQKFIPRVLDKLSYAVSLREKLGLSFLIQVDGGINPQNYKALYDRGLDVFVMGSGCMFKGDEDPKKRADTMCKEFAEAIKQ